MCAKDSERNSEAITIHKKHYLLKWYEYMCNKANSTISEIGGVDSLFVCPTPDGDIWDCEDCRYNRRELEKEVMEARR